MIPAWRRDGGNWVKCWLISTAPHGASEGHVLVALDDHPAKVWGYPPGSLRLASVNMEFVRIRRDVVPVMEETANGDQ